MHDRAVEEANMDFVQCTVSAVAADIKGADLGKILGLCCVASPTAVFCAASAVICKTRAHGETINGTILEYGDDAVDPFCTEWCNDAKVDWCPQKLSTAAIIGIVVAALIPFVFMAIGCLLKGCCCK
jgi:hypothetical protein